MSREEIEEEIRGMKKIFDFHASNQIIKGDREFMKHIDAILDRIAELEMMLKEMNE